MTTLPTSVLPKRIPHEPHKASSAIHVSPPLLEAAGNELETVLQKLHTSKGGLSGKEAEQPARQRALHEPQALLLRDHAALNHAPSMLAVAFHGLPAEASRGQSSPDWWSNQWCFTPLTKEIQ